MASAKRRPKRRRASARQRRLVLLSLSVTLLLAVAWLTLRRYGCGQLGAPPPFPVRPGPYKPLRFDPRRAPREIRVLRVRRPYYRKRCEASYHGHCIQALPLEDYVRGVVLAEEGIFRQRALKRGGTAALAKVAEAWKIQAIAARSYALYCVLNDKYYQRKTGFNITDGPRDQVYRNAREPAIDRAVAATRGQVLVNHKRRLIYAEYSASCGGRGTFDIQKRRQRITCHPKCKHFAFKGSTHRRGLCQWGSFLFALAGHKLPALRRRFYPNARLLRLPGGS